MFRDMLFGALLGFLFHSVTILVALSIDRRFQGIRMCRWIQHGRWNGRANRRCTVARVSVVVAVISMISMVGVNVEYLRDSGFNRGQN